MSRPTIGVTAATESISYGPWKNLAAIVGPRSYVRAVQEAGGRAVLLVPDPEDARDPDGVLDLLDALVLTGGAGDLDPALYGQEPHPETGPISIQDHSHPVRFRNIWIRPITDKKPVAPTKPGVKH